MTTQDDLVSACLTLGNNFITIRPEAQQKIKKYRQVYPDLSGIVEHLDKAFKDGWFKLRQQGSGRRSKTLAVFSSVPQGRR